MSRSLGKRAKEGKRVMVQGAQKSGLYWSIQSRG